VPNAGDGGLAVDTELGKEVRDALTEIVDELTRQGDDTKVTRDAVVLVDTAIHEFSGRIATLEAQVTALGASKAEQLKNMVTAGDWLGTLHVASRDSKDNVDQDDLPPGHGDGDADHPQGTGIFGALQTG
jgi:hypothetical protein